MTLDVVTVCRQTGRNESYKTTRFIMNFARLVFIKLLSSKLFKTKEKLCQYKSRTEKEISSNGTHSGKAKLLHSNHEKERNLTITISDW